LGGISLSEEVIARLAERCNIVARHELLRIVAQNGLFAGKEVVCGWLGRRVLDVGLRCRVVHSAPEAKLSPSGLAGGLTSGIEILERGEAVGHRDCVPFG